MSIYVCMYIYIYIYIYMCVCVCVCVCLGVSMYTLVCIRIDVASRNVFTHTIKMWHKVNFKWSFICLNSNFSVLTGCQTKVKEHSLPYYLLSNGRRIVGFIPFPRILAQCEMQTNSSRIWTRFAVFVSFENNHFSRSVTDMYVYVYWDDETVGCGYW